MLQHYLADANPKALQQGHIQQELALNALVTQCLVEANVTALQ